MYLNKLILSFDGVETVAHHYSDRIETELGHTFDSLSELYRTCAQPMNEKDVATILSETDGVPRNEVVEILQMNDGDVFHTLLVILDKYGANSFKKKSEM
jgi:hypothetical protein